MLGMNEQHYPANIKRQVMTLCRPDMGSWLDVVEHSEVTQSSSQHHVLSQVDVWQHSLILSTAEKDGVAW